MFHPILVQHVLKQLIIKVDSLVTNDGSCISNLQTMLNLKKLMTTQSSLVFIVVASTYLAT